MSSIPSACLQGNHYSLLKHATCLFAYSINVYLPSFVSPLCATV